MNSDFRRISGPTAAVAALCVSTAALASDDAETASSRAQEILIALQSTTGVPGMAAAIWRSGEIIWAGEAGHQDEAGAIPVREDTVFRLASVSKVFAATAAVKLAEDGNLDLDAPVQTLVSGLNPDWPPITARQLAAHTSGIPHYQAIDRARGRKRFNSVSESLSIFNSRTLLFEPGTDYNYSSYGYTLLSAVIEAASGDAYLDFIGRKLVDGLDIGPDRTDSGDPRASAAFDYRDGALARSEPHDYSYSWGGAGIGGSARDVAIFGGRVLSGDILGADALASMFEPTKLKNGADVSDRDFKVGFGWRISIDANGERIAHHAGSTLGARSVLVLYPEREISISFLSNAPWVASIEATAATIVAAVSSESGKEVRKCPTKARRHEGVFGDEKIAGAARFKRKGRTCVGEIEIEGAAAEWFDRFPQGDANSFSIIAFDKKGGFSSGAIITPIGAFQIKAGAGHGEYSGEISSRQLVIRLFDK